MIYPASYQTGFAPRDFEPQYPELLDGLVGAWCPSLGPTGATLRDWSGRANHGTLFRMTVDSAWRVSGGYSLQFDGIDDQVECGRSASLEVQEHSLSAWLHPTDFLVHRMYAGKSDSISGGGIEWSVGTGGSAGMVGFAYNDGGIRGWYYATEAIPSGVWSHVVVVWRKSAGAVDFYINGRFVSTSATTTGTIVYSNDMFDIGHASLNDYWLGLIDDVRLYGIALPTSNISLLSRGRGIAFTPRRRTVVSIPSGGRLLELRRRACA